METVSFDQVRFTAGFWRERTELNRQATIPKVYELCRSTGRIEAMKLQWQPGQPDHPHIFWDSDVAKWMEAAAYELKRQPDPELQAQLDEIIALIAAAQDNDGYYNSFYQTVEPRHKRFSNLMFNHEMYCAGHLMEAAAAHYDATGETGFLEVMKKYADHIDRRFGPEPEKAHGYPGHEEIELALVKLYHATGEKRYLKLSEYFVRERGRRPSYYVQEGERLGEKDGQRHRQSSPFNLPYFQAHAPIEEQEEAVGHAVRALYYYSGAADIARECNDEKLAAACRRLWDDVVNRKMYITGATGSCYHGETFAAAYDLPNAAAYAETCTSIALIYFSWRMFRLDGDARYLDILEKALYNGVMSAISLDGKKFFYVNPLACRPGTTLSNGRKHVPRTEWFDCSCCPTNLARLFASAGEYFYAVDGPNIYVNLYGDNETELTCDAGPVKLTQQTAYPWNGKIVLKIEPARKADFTVRLRLPGWCAAPSASLNGKVLPPTTERGFLVVSREWRSGDRLELELPMTPQLVYSHPAVQENAGRAALQRGPLIYCLEEADNGPELDQLTIATADGIEECTIAGLPGPLIGLRLKGSRTAPSTGGELYSTRPAAEQACTVTAVPYYAWNNRGFGEMQVWTRVR